MTNADNHTLTRSLCPWLAPALERLELASREGRLGHAWLIQGPEGIGKTNLALVFATRLLSGKAPGPPAELGAEAFRSGMQARYEAQNHHPDLHWLYPETGKSSIAVDQVRSVCESLGLSSYSGSAKVVVIEPAEAMTTSAANALLKTLEEPTRNSYLLLVSHRPGLLPATVRSRCQQLALHPPDEVTVARWAARRTAEPDVLQAIAPQRSPLSWLESLESDAEDAERERSKQLAELLGRRANALTIADQWSKGDVDHTLAWLVRMLHGLIRLRFMQHASKLITESGESNLHNAARALSVRALFDRLDEAERLRSELAGGINVQLAMRALLLGFLPDKGMT